MSRNAILLTLGVVVGLFAVISVPITMATLTAPTTNARSTFYSTSIYSPTALGAAWNSGSVGLNWTPPAGGGNGNGYLVSGMNNGSSNACPATAASYTTVVGSTSGAVYTDSSSSLLQGNTWSYLCYLVQTGYNPVGAAPWAGAPAWTNATNLATVAVQMTITHTQNKCVIGTGATFPAVFTAAVKAGDLLVAVGRANGAPTVADNVNGAWTRANINGSVGLYYKQNTLAAAAGAMTVTITGTSIGNDRLCIDEFNGLATVNALFKSSNRSTASSPWTATGIPNVPATYLVVAGMGSNQNNGVVTQGTTNGATMTLGGRVTDALHGTLASEYLVSSTAGTQNASFTMAPSNSMQGDEAVFAPRGFKALVQSGTDVINNAGGNVTGTLPVASTAGNLLIAVVNNSGGTGMTAPAGWVRAVGISGAAGTSGIWYYANNPGNITNVAFTSPGGWAMAQLSEWNGYAAATPLDQTGSTTVGTTTSTVTAAGATSGSDELVVTGFALVSSVTTFTSGGGWSTMVNDPANGILNDYELGVATGSTPSETATTDIDPGGWDSVLATFK